MAARSSRKATPSSDRPARESRSCSAPIPTGCGSSSLARSKPDGLTGGATLPAQKHIIGAVAAMAGMGGRHGQDAARERRGGKPARQAASKHAAALADGALAGDYEKRSPTSARRALDEAQEGAKGL